MDIIKKKIKKTTNVVTVYIKENDMPLVDFLRERDVNISMVCRRAIREVAEKLMTNTLEDKKDKLIVKCNGMVSVNTDNNEFIFEDYIIRN